MADGTIAPGVRACTRCGEVKQADRGYFGDAGGGRIKRVCLACLAADRRARRAADPEKYRLAVRNADRAAKARDPDAWRAKKAEQQRRARAAKPIDVMRATSRNEYHKHAERLRAQRKEARAADLVNRRAAERTRAARRRLHVAFCLHSAMRSRMSEALKAAGSSKQRRSWLELVDYTIADLMRHLEAQFLPGMTWANRGKWHIDHRLPLASFNVTGPDCPEFRRAWALSNLQPLWAADNLRKGAKRLTLL